MQSLIGKITGSTLTAAEWNQLPNEVQNVITTLGITLSSGDLNQLGKAIAGYVANGTFYTDGGSANAYVLTTIGSKQTPTAYTDGLEAEFVVATTNTGASTINIAGLGVKDIAATATTGTLTAGDMVRVRYNLGTGDVDILNNTGTVSADASETVKGIAKIATQVDIDAGADDTRIVTSLKMRFGFASLFATNGYVTFPSWLGGLIIQWGILSSIAYGTTGTVTFPIAFPTAGFHSSFMQVTAASAVAAENYSLALTTTQSNVFNTSGVTATYRWIALGY